MEDIADKDVLNLMSVDVNDSDENSSKTFSFHNVPIGNFHQDIGGLLFHDQIFSIWGHVVGAARVNQPLSDEGVLGIFC